MLKYELEKSYKTKKVLIPSGLQQNSNEEVSYQQLQKLVSLSKNAFVRGHFEQALSLGEQASKLFEEHFVLSTEEKVWQANAEILLVKILALERLERLEGTQQNMRLLIAQMPKYVPDPALVPPKISEIYAEEKNTLSSQQVGELKIESNPSDAEVYLNGVKIGQTPLTIKDILPGEHHVLIIKDYKKSQKKVFLAGEDVNTVLQLIGGKKDYDDMAKKFINPIEPKKISKSAYITEATNIRLPLIAFYLSREDKYLRLTMAKVLNDKRIAYRSIRFNKDLKQLNKKLSPIIKFSVNNDQSLIVDDKELENQFFRHSALTKVTKKIGIDENENGGTIDQPKENEDNTLLYIATASAVTVAVAAAITGAIVYYFYFMPSNPNGTDIIIDSSKLN